MCDYSSYFRKRVYQTTRNDYDRLVANKKEKHADNEYVLVPLYMVYSNVDIKKADQVAFQTRRISVSNLKTLRQYVEKIFINIRHNKVLDDLVDEVKNRNAKLPKSSLASGTYPEIIDDLLSRIKSVEIAKFECEPLDVSYFIPNLNRVRKYENVWTYKDYINRFKTNLYEFKPFDYTESSFEGHDFYDTMDIATKLRAEKAMNRNEINDSLYMLEFIFKVWISEYPNYLCPNTVTFFNITLLQLLLLSMSVEVDSEEENLMLSDVGETFIGLQSIFYTINSIVFTKLISIHQSRLSSQICIKLIYMNYHPENTLVKMMIEPNEEKRFKLMLSLLKTKEDNSYDNVLSLESFKTIIEDYKTTVPGFEGEYYVATTSMIDSIFRGDLNNMLVELFRRLKNKVKVSKELGLDMDLIEQTFSNFNFNK